MGASMKVSPKSPALQVIESQLAAAATQGQIAAAVLVKQRDIAKTEGSAVMRMIDAAAGENRPLADGPVGRTINIGV